MKNLLIAASAIALSALWACHLDPKDSETKLNIQGDQAWTGYDKVLVEVRDLEGKVIDTLFIGKLGSLDQLKDLPAGKYGGGDAVFVIKGFQGGTLVFEQTRKFSESKGTAVVETTLAVDAPLRTFKAAPESLLLWLGGPDTVIKLEIIPAFSRPRLVWEYDKSALEITPKDGAYEARIKTLREGPASLTVRPEGVDSLARRIGIGIVADVPRLSVTPSKLFVAPGAEAEFTVKSAQEFGDIVLFQWDLDGDGGWDDSLAGKWEGKEVELPKRKRAFAKAGRYTVRFRARDGEGNWGSCEALVEAGERRPAVELAPRADTLSIKDEVKFTGILSEPGGRLTEYSWDWNGDGKVDQGSTLNDSTATLRETRVYNDTGVFRIILSAKDADGKTGADSAEITVLKDAPVVNAGAAVTAKTTVPVAFAGSATQDFGTFTMYKWDYDGNGTWDDSSATPPAFTHAYGAEAEYSARLLVRDDDGNETIAVRKVTVSDVPFIITAMREDTSISIKDVVTFFANVRNDDAKALVYRWDWHGDGIFDDSTATNKTEFRAQGSRTFNSAGRFKVVFKVQDSQGKSLTDSTIVTVSVDAPKAILGPDDTVLTGETVAVKLTDSQNFGSIVKRELRLNDTVWIPISKSDTTVTMPQIKGLFRIIGRVTDDDGQTGLDTMDITVNYPTENHLAALLLTPGTLSPAFHSDSTAYSVTYAYATSAVVVSAAPRDPKSTITVNGTALTSTVTQVTVNLAAGANAIPVIVTAQDTAAKRTYTLNLTRSSATEARLSAITLSAGTLSPAFNADTSNYSAAYAFSAGTINVGAVPVDANAKVTINGTALGGPVTTVAVPLSKVGANPAVIVVTSQDSTVKRTYTVNLNKAASTEVRLSKLVPSAGLLTPPVFAPSTYLYNLAVADSVDTLQFTPTGLDTMQRIRVAGVAVASAAPSQKLPVKIGVDTVAIEVTAGSGAKVTYKVAVTRKGWTLAGSRGFSGPRQGLQSFSADKGVPYAAMVDSAATNSLALWKWEASAWSNIGTGFGDVNIQDMAVDAIDGVPWVVSLTGGSTKNIRKHANGAWSLTGKTLPSAYGHSEFSISHDKTGRPYIAYRHGYIQNQHFIYKFMDTAWVFQPMTGALDSVLNLRMVVNPATGYPVAAFTRTTVAGTSFRAMVETHNGTAYSQLGTTGWPVANARIDVAFDSLGNGYYAYLDPATRKAMVKRYNGIWGDLGPVTGISEGEASSLCIVAAGTTPVIAYRDAARATVVTKVWTGTAWIDFGDTETAVGDVATVRLAVDGTGVWLAYWELANARVSVMKRPLP